MILQDDKLAADVMFIADLHLHPQQPKITTKFLNFCEFAKSNTKELYILGDFIHAWPGDDAIDEWSKLIIKTLAELVDSGVKVYFMAGNRDFLLGKRFLRQAKVKYLPDPSVISLGGKRVLLTHGDRYCTKDKAHQRWRLFTRNKLFKLIFLRVPYKYRFRMVNKVRQYSTSWRSSKPHKDMLTVPEAILNHLRKYNLSTVIHGHTHLPGLTEHKSHAGIFLQYVLSDWDAEPLIMCYNCTNKFYYSLFAES